jgi:hypothetical protein
MTHYHPAIWQDHHAPDYKVWTESDEIQLRLMHKRGKSSAEMGCALGRSRGAINVRLHHLGLSRKQTVRRTVNPSRGAVLTEARGFASLYGLDFETFMGACRKKKYAWPRQDFWRHIYETTSASLPFLADIFERDHTTVLYGIRQSAKRASTSNEEN